MKFKFTQHAIDQMKDRDIDVSLVEKVLNDPQQKVDQETGEMVYQSKLPRKGGKSLLLRVVVIQNTNPNLVITVYWTSNFKKYWRLEE